MNRTTPSAPSVSRRDQPARSQLIAFVAFAVLICIGVLLYSIAQYGQVNGEEFSPDNFTRRHFTYYQIPILKVQVLPIDRQDGTNELETYLVSEKLISEVKTTDAQRRWDLVLASNGGAGGPKYVFTEGEARILCSYLDAQGANKNFVWLEWSKQHQDLAKIVWPLVAKLARQELYVFVPDLLLAARGASDAAALQQSLDRLLAEKYMAFATTQQQLGRHDLAVELFTEAIALGPELAAAFTGRAKSLTILGQKDKATADLAQAEKIGTRR